MYFFPNLEQSVVPCPVLTVASWPAYRFLGRQVWWSGIPISLTVSHSLLWKIHTVKGFGIVNKAEVDFFLELFCFFDDPADVGNLISHSSSSSKSSLNIWMFMVTYCWSLAWRILSITLLARVRWILLRGSLNILWHCLSLGLEWKQTFSSSSTLCFSEFSLRYLRYLSSCD